MHIKSIMEEPSLATPLPAALLLLLFLLVLLTCSLRAPVMYCRLHGRSHRILGLCLFFWLILGVVQVILTSSTHTVFSLLLYPSPFLWVYYDVVLSLLGACTAATAALSFGKTRAHVMAASKNKASGANVTLGLSGNEYINCFTTTFSPFLIQLLHQVPWTSPPRSLQRRCGSMCSTKASLKGGGSGFLPSLYQACLLPGESVSFVALYM